MEARKAKPNEETMQSPLIAFVLHAGTHLRFTKRTVLYQVAYAR
jgi:hypothetical protein